MQTMKLVLKNTCGETVSLYIRNDETFDDLKKRVQNEVGISLDLNDLTIKGRTISDKQKVVDYFTYQETKAEDSKPPEPEVDLKCAVPGCGNTKFACPDKAFFNFPLEEVRCHQWALYCQRLTPDSGKHRIALNMNSVICADHFRRDQFVKNTTTLLKRTAVPCIKPEIPLSTEACHVKRRAPSIKSIKHDFNLPLPISLPGLDSTTSTLSSNTVHVPIGAGENAVLCRICATMSNDVLFIYDDVGTKLKISEKINTHLPVTIKSTDPLPKQVCRTCFDKLTLCHEFSELSLKAEKTLQELMSKNHFSTKSLKNDTEAVPDVRKNGIESDSNRGSNRSNKPSYCCPLCSSGQMYTKSGIYKVKHGNPTNAENLAEKESADESELLVDVVSIPDKEQDETTGQDASDHDGKELWNNQDYGLKISELDMDSIYNDPEGIVGMELDSIEEENWNDEEELDIKPFIKDQEVDFSCRICGLDFIDLTSQLDHSDTHCEEDYFPCTLCELYYSAKADLEVHFLDHQTPIGGSNQEVQYYQCELCSIHFKSLSKLQNHACGVVNATSNRCLHCNKTFRSKSRLLFHQRFHQGAKPGYCEICQKTFPDEVKLYKHTIYLHSQNKGHCCEECGKVFKSVSSLRYHQRSHQGEDIMKPYPCEQCGKCFIRKSMLRNHMLSIHKNLSQQGSCYTCKLCTEAFPTTEHAVAHMEMHHLQECSNETSYSFDLHTVSRLYICEYCERCFTDPINLNNHRDQHPPDLPYQCKLCGEAYPSYLALEEHNPIHNTHEGSQDYAKEFTVPRVYMCEYCERCFLNYIKLSEHLTVHYGEEPYQCRFCDHRFKTLAEVTEHRLSHDQSVAPIDDFDFYRPYECHYCRKSFAIEDALVKHIRMHTGEKPFICDQCGKGFSQSSGLYTHQKVHSDERPYNCPVCPRTFKIKGDRDVHVRKHSGERPYKCDFCGKAFMTQHVFSQHRKIHTGERPYKCDVCGIAFRRSHVLTVHKRIHTGEKPNICDICGKRYRQKGDMLKHRRIQHGLVKVKIQRFDY